MNSISVDLEDLVPTLRREVSPPNEDLYLDLADADLVGHLSDSFWEARLFGFFDNYDEVEGIVSPISGTTDLSRQDQALVVIFAGIRIIRNAVINKNTVFRTKAGPVEFETQNSATVLAEVLKQLQAKVTFIHEQLGSLGAVTDYYIDGLAARDASLRRGDTSWWG